MFLRLPRPNSRFINNPHYRPDIDGLRAISVLLVILFHLDLSAFSGGYVGVDLFFVISGYLITSQIYREMREGKFSFKQFYKRRLRRIAPALGATLVLSTLGAVLLFSPIDLVSMAKSLLASLAFVANGFFYLHSGYFETTDETHPLRHLWSLAVEEQFYLFLPLFLWILMRRFPKADVRGVLLVMGTVSLVMAFLGSMIDSKAAFYLMPTRFFEFLIGASLIWLPALKSTTRPFLWDACWLLGAALIGASVIYYDAHTPFPSFYALAPCLGAALIIYAGQRESTRLFLSHPIMSYLGRVSYEWYLMHWPLIVFYQYTAMHAKTAQDNIALLALSLVLAMLIYHFISCPIRYGTRASTQPMRYRIVPLIATLLLLLGCATSIIRSGGWEWRIDQKGRLLATNAGEFHKTQFGGAGYVQGEITILGDTSTPPQFILFGDSFASQYAGAMSDFLKANKRSAYLYFVNACMVAPDVIVTIEGRSEINKPCTPAFSKVITLAQKTKLPILYAQSWANYTQLMVSRKGGKPLTFAKNSNDAYYQYMIRIISQWHALLPQQKLVVVGISPGIGEQKSIAKCFRVPSYLPNGCSDNVSAPEDLRQNGQGFNLTATKYIAEHPEVAFMNPRSALCRGGQCYAVRDGHILYSDYLHLTKAGAEEVINYHAKLLLSLKP